jgi:hypothetical protein
MKSLFLGKTRRDFFPDRQDVYLMPGETKTIHLERRRGQRVGGEIRGLPKDVPGAFVSVRPVAATGLHAREWQLATFDALACARDARFRTSLLKPGQYKIIAEAYLPKSESKVTGWRMPAFLGTAEVTIQDDNPADPKKPAPFVSVEMKPPDPSEPKEKKEPLRQTR